ncbi:MAG: hypothetical protein AAGU21_13795 [Solidesulfovibrio sp.]|uniref:hypothetical protein n=1 Tax=Solidesulfovibrio sp. TaxID=2910990 RepID=UPI002B21BE97|nr:hypothetical protein [Solidesulfovibrio sp.]MEA4857760.1 hypothetical protein [Solidesulfovibrio sp.]
MAFPENIGQFFSRLINSFRGESAAWRREHQPELDRQREERLVTASELKNRLELMEIRFREECRRTRMEEERQTEQFAEFLASIDEMKANMLDYYATMPKPLALMIHHHAAELLKEAWHSPDARQRVEKQARFTRFMLTVTEDLAALGDGQTAKALPEKTIAFIQDEAE